eukprot:c25337_g1_i2 orf=236-2245(-)
MSSSQHRCVFVGNIPYDATEEQLIQICEEVGPVVSFRLVLDRETGKPKGYGFCEFRDEETALSARRNLQGYEINGRQLRVDFAENDKGVDRNREQGRGGPGFTPTIDTQKHTSGVRPLGEASFDQPLGITVAAAAAAVMAGALGGSQVPVIMGQGQIGNMGSNGQPNGGGGAGSAVGNDPLTNHLAGMSKHQLYEIVSQMKDLIQQNEQQARQILVANPQLTKALFQAQIMLGMVRPPNPQMLPNIQQPLLQNVTVQSQSQVHALQQQVQTQMVQPSSVQTVPIQPQAIQPIQQGQMQQHQVQVVQTSQSQNVQVQHHMQGIPQPQTQNLSIQSQVSTHQLSQSLPIQLPGQPVQQSHVQTTSGQLPFQNAPQPPPHGIGMQIQAPMQLGQLQQPSLQQSNMPLPHMQRPLTQQTRPPASHQVQPQTVQSMGFQLPPAPQQASVSQPTLQQLGGMPQSSLGIQYQHMQTPQQSFQVTRSGPDMGGGPSLAPGGMPSSTGMLTGGVGIGLGGHQVGRGSAPVAWNQPPASGSIGGVVGVSHSNAPMAVSGHVGSNHSLSGAVGIAPPLQVGSGTLPMQQEPKGYGGSRGNHGGTGASSEGPSMLGMIQSQGYGQAIQPSPQLQLQPQMQLPLEQQKVLLQQVMNLTQEQINSLPPEQRQQVLQLQQAFRS